MCIRPVPSVSKKRRGQSSNDASKSNSKRVHSQVRPPPRPLPGLGRHKKNSVFVCPSLPSFRCTQKRGGRHEGLLEMLSENGFHVRALDPTCADDLRARVAGDSSGSDSSGCPASRASSIPGADGGGRGGGGCCTSRAWAGPEWRRENPQDKNKRKIELVRRADEDENERHGEGRTIRDDVVAGEAGTGSRGIVAGRDEGGGGCGGGHESIETAPATGAPLGGAVRRFERGPVSADGEGGGWGYKEHGLGKILAFVARRRCDSGGGGGGDDGEEASG